MATARLTFKSETKNFSGAKPFCNGCANARHLPARRACADASASRAAGATVGSNAPHIAAARPGQRARLDESRRPVSFGRWPCAGDGDRSTNGERPFDVRVRGPRRPRQSREARGRGVNLALPTSRGAHPRRHTSFSEDQPQERCVHVRPVRSAREKLGARGISSGRERGEQTSRRFVARTARTANRRAEGSVSFAPVGTCQTGRQTSDDLL